MYCGCYISIYSTFYSPSMLTKQDYNLYYPTFIRVRYLYDHNQLDSYTRSLIRKEQTLPFKLLINMKYNIWRKNKKLPV